jgi:hypothetical protein
MIDEARFNRDFAHEGFPPVHISAGRDHLRSQAEVLADASEEGADYIRDLHGKIFGADPDLLARAYAAIDSDPQTVGAMDKTQIDNEFRMRIITIEAAMNSVKNDPAFDPERGVELYGAVRAIISMLISMNDLLLAMNTVKSVGASAMAGMLTSDAKASWRYMTAEGDEPANAIQRLYRIAFERAQKMGFARYKDGVMRRVVTKDGFITNAWERVATFQDFVYSLTRDPIGEIHFLSTKAVNIMENVAELLSKSLEAEVPWLKPDRHVFAFRNGCYMAKDERFITFTRDSPPVMPDGKPCPTACKYHDADVDPSWVDCPDPMDIPTPLMSHIMDTQKLRADVKRVYYSMLGRAIYDLGEMDNWQVFLFIRGAAETGKSTLLKFASSFYNSEDIGILANNVEGTFGASMLAEKFVVVGDDLGENFSLDQQLFQNMSSGNEVSLPRKNKLALITTWITQLLLSGNVLPDFKDNSGSFSRRLLIIYYSKPVRHVDPTIPERLKGEMGAAIIKCNRCYRNMVRRFSWLLTRPGHPVTFWDAVPEEFRIQKRNVMQCANSIMSFLNSGALTYSPSLYMPRDLFVTHLMNHCQGNGIPKPRFQPSQYDGAFAIMGLEVTHGKQKHRYPRTATGKDMFEVWIVGCDMVIYDSVARASVDSIKAAESAVQSYMRDPSEASRVTAGAMRASRKRGAAPFPSASAAAAASSSAGDAAASSSAGDTSSPPPPPQRPRLV